MRIHVDIGAENTDGRITWPLELDLPAVPRKGDMLYIAEDLLKDFKGGYARFREAEWTVEGKVSVFAEVFDADAE